MNARTMLERSANNFLSRFDVSLKRNRPMRDPVQLFLLKARELGAATILDIGANRGQFASEIFASGWNGDLVSFEPVAETHRSLSQAASANPHWFVHPPIALGSKAATAEINVAGNLVSSSLLRISSASTDANPQTRCVRTETVSVRPLDEVVQPSWVAPFALKTDTEGFELEVLRGGSKTLSRTRVIMIEMCLTPLHEGGAHFGDLVNFIRDAGFRCIALTEGFSDYDRNEVLAVDGVFVRGPSPS